MPSQSSGGLRLERTELERRLRRALEQQPQVRWAYLFGSAARGETYRDVDVALMLEPDARGPVPLGAVINALEAAGAGAPIDVVALDSVSPVVAGSVVREGRVLIDRAPVERIAWEIDANRIALDIEPWLRRYGELRRAALRSRTL